MKLSQHVIKYVVIFNLLHRLNSIFYLYLRSVSVSLVSFMSLCFDPRGELVVLADNSHTDIWSYLIIFHTKYNHSLAINTFCFSVYVHKDREDEVLCKDQHLCPNSYFLVEQISDSPCRQIENH